MFLKQIFLILDTWIREKYSESSLMRIEEKQNYESSSPILSNEKFDGSIYTTLDRQAFLITNSLTIRHNPSAPTTTISRCIESTLLYSII